VEVNASPSLSPSTHSDRIMKLNLIRDVYRIVVPQDSQGWAEWRGSVHSGPMRDSGDFVVLYDEAAVTGGYDEESPDGERGGAEKIKKRGNLEDLGSGIPRSFLGKK